MSTEKELREKVKAAAAEYYQEIYGKRRELSYIPASGKVLGSEELQNMIDASLDMWLTAGRFHYQFEQKFASLIGRDKVVVTNSGSSANLLAFTALTSPLLGNRALKKGDEVISVAAGFPTTINPIFMHGMVPVFIDIELGTYNIDSSKIEEAITDKTKAIFLAHTLGNPYDLECIVKLAKKHNLWVIEDCCDALGAEFNGKKVGTFGDIATFSFYPAHHITMGEGGAVGVNDPLLYKIVKSFRDWGRDCACPPGCDNSCGHRFTQKLGNLPYGYDHKYTYSHLGFNLKITDWQAAIGCAQIEKLQGFLKAREENASFLLDQLSDLKDFLILPEVLSQAKSAWFGFLISVKPNDKYTKQALIEFLEQHKIGTRQLFAGNVLRQPMIVESDVNFRVGNSHLMNSSELRDSVYALLPNTDFVMNNTFWVGVYPGLTKVELEKTSRAIHEYFNR
ncbi:MAG: lipopolysaccharide biosynthesis protein RfbH [Succinivibrio sp.]|nr:lipopolysaccharide biosynthesis protein RfbH [Succinivibrio sp.]